MLSTSPIFSRGEEVQENFFLRQVPAPHLSRRAIIYFGRELGLGLGRAIARLLWPGANDGSCAWAPVFRIIATRVRSHLRSKTRGLLVSSFLFWNIKMSLPLGTPSVLRCSRIWMAKFKHFKIGSGLCPADYAQFIQRPCFFFFYIRTSEYIYLVLIICQATGYSLTLLTQIVSFILHSLGKQVLLFFPFYTWKCSNLAWLHNVLSSIQHWMTELEVKSALCVQILFFLLCTITFPPHFLSRCGFHRVVGDRQSRSVLSLGPGD